MSTKEHININSLYIDVCVFERVHIFINYTDLRNTSSRLLLTGGAKLNTAKKNSLRQEWKASE